MVTLDSTGYCGFLVMALWVWNLQKVKHIRFGIANIIMNKAAQWTITRRLTWPNNNVLQKNCHCLIWEDCQQICCFIFASSYWWRIPAWSRSTSWWRISDWHLSMKSWPSAGTVFKYMLSYEIISSYFWTSGSHLWAWVTIHMYISNHIFDLMNLTL